MRFGIFADVHANFEALDAVLERLKTKNIERYICAGDLVGYGPNPNECIDIIRNLPSVRIVAGNHDRAACGLKDITWFNEYARESMRWTQRVISAGNRAFLAQLPVSVMLRDITVFHGSPQDPVDEYLITREQFTANIALVKTPVAVVGHTHAPAVFDGEVLGHPRGPETMTLTEDRTWIINPGAVGQPRDADNRASCAVFDTATRVLEFQRIEYNIELTQQKMRNVKLPGFLIERLTVGK
jgi:predicted phosphodiesterase